MKRLVLLVMVIALALAAVGCNSTSDHLSKIKDAGKVLEIQVLDHLIVTSESFYSFADNGVM